MHPWKTSLRSYACLLVAALACACAKQPPALASATLNAISSNSTLASQVVRVTVTLSASDLNTITVDLTQGAAGWTGLLSGIKPGVGRNFHADAFDGATPPHKLFTGDALNVQINAGPATNVNIVLEQVNAPPPFMGSEPVIDSLVLSSNDVGFGQTVTLTAAAHDSDPTLTPTLSYAWTTTGGSFTPPDAAKTVFLAPNTAQTVTLTLTVTDTNQQKASVSVSVTVESSPGTGAANVTVTFDEAPAISAMTPTPSYLIAGQPTSVDVTATVARGNLSYAWTSTCTDGSFDTQVGTPVVFTLPQETGDKSCTLSVVVSSDLGPSAMGSLILSVQPGVVMPEVLPQIDYQFQSTASIIREGSIALQISAHSPQGQALTFAWTDTSGLIGSQTDTATSSSVSWALLANCASIPDTATVTVTDASGGSVSTSFTVNSSCDVAVFDTARFDSSVFAD